MALTSQTRTGRCPTHGTVQAERQLPQLSFPFIITAAMRYLAKRKPFRCPECGSPIAMGTP